MTRPAGDLVGDEFQGEISAPIFNGQSKLIDKASFDLPAGVGFFLGNISGATPFCSYLQLPLLAISSCPKLSEIMSGVR